MKLSLIVKITIKDFFPKDQSIPYEKYICLFSLNNFNAKINLSNLNNQNFIMHKVESFNSNIIYNLHMFDSNNNSLIGIYQLILNFDKIKHLNINDTLTQEETAKLIIDQKTKRKIFDKLTNMGDIFLLLSIEIKVIDKKLYSSGNKQTPTDTKKGLNIENSEKVSEFNLTPKTFKKKQIIRTIKNDREALKRMDTFSAYNESGIIEDFKDENEPMFAQDNTIKKYKSLNKAIIMRQNKDGSNCLYNSNNQYFNNSCTMIISPNHCNTNYNFKKDGKIKTNRKKKLAHYPQKKVTILNLMEQKLGSSLCTKKEDNSLELSIQSKDFKNTSFNFTKATKINNISTRNSISSFNNYACNFNEIKKQNSIKKKNIKHFDESDFFQRKTYQNKNKIFVNLSSKSNNEQMTTESKGIKKNKRQLSLINTKRLNTEININKNENKSNKNININNIFLQTESEIKSERKKLLRKHLKTNTDLKQLFKEKNSLIKENFNNNYYMDKSRGTFSPKLSLKIKFNEGAIIQNEKMERNSNRYKDRINKKILTPKGNQIKKVCFNNEDNLKKENEELKKKCFNLINFYSLLTTKLKKTCKNNIESIKKLEIIKERLNNLKKYKYRIIQIQNLNDSKKIEKHANIHYEEEKLFNKMLNIKLKENYIYENILGENIDKENIQNKLNILFTQKKELLLNLIRNIVKFYGNISQIYNNDKNKKDQFIKLINKYDIKEKIKTDLNYISYMNKGNHFNDRIITEVDEDKENEEEDEEKIDKFNEFNVGGGGLINKENNINMNNDNSNNNNNNKIYYKMEQKVNNNNKIQEIKIFNIKNYINNNIDNNINNNNEDNNIDNNYDENLNNLIEKILIEQFPENYKTNMRFIHKEKNKYFFKNNIFYAYIEDNDVVLKEEINGIINNNKLTLNEFYHKYCTDKSMNNFIYTKKIRQKYIKIKSYEDKEIYTDKRIKNENSTTIETEQKQNTSNSKINEINDEKVQ